MTHETRDAFWEREDVVEEFAARKPDHRLRALLEHHETPGAFCVLDIGCAGGRNTEWLAERGFDVYGLDPSEAMVRRTRERMIPLLGREQAFARVKPGTMQDLSEFPDGRFDLVIALGVYHNARSRGDWDRSIAETVRVLKPGGHVLLSNFSPRSQPTGEPLEPVKSEPRLYTGFSSGALYLVGPDLLDADLGSHGLHPATPTEAVQAPTDRGFRISVNGLYIKRPTTKE